MFIPKRILFEKDTLDYAAGQRIYDAFKDTANVEIIKLTSNRINQHIPGDDLFNKYREGKKTLVVGIKSSFKFQSCKPSAHYQLPLVSGCMGQCQYCYLNTNLGDKPFLKVYVNIDEILFHAQKYIDERLPDTTIFEGSATSDPIPVEPFTHSLAKAIEFFGSNNNSRFRFVTKYNDVDTLLNIRHNGHTEVRFSINTETIIRNYELGTASAKHRIEAGMKIAKAGYPIGFLIAPVFIYPDWEDEYKKVLLDLHEVLPDTMEYPVTFEVISHRYTSRAKNRILEIFPSTTLPMDDEKRKYKYGQFGYGKWVYPEDEMAIIHNFFSKEIGSIFKNGEIKYII